MKRDKYRNADDNVNHVVKLLLTLAVATTIPVTETF